MIHAMDAFAGAIGVSDSDGKATPVYAACVNRGEYYTNSVYYAYLLRYMSKAGYIESLAKGIRERSTDFRFNDFAKLNLPIPPCDEQDRIANFLDQKIAEIDEAIAKKQRLIELLKEQKAILINQAVTKGLNPDVPMHDSGVEWIGGVPAHWKMPPMYARFRIELGKMLDAKRITGKNLVRYLRNTDVQWGKINLDDLPEMDIHPSELSRYVVRNGDLLVCEGGEIGRCAIWESDIKGQTIGFQKALHRLRAFSSEKENIRYLYYVMMAAWNLGAFQLTAKTNTISHLTGEMFRVYRFPQPPKREQDAIVETLDIACGLADKIIQEQLYAITLFTELKSTIIANAVTGKIKI